MFNDKMMIEIASNYIYSLDQLANKTSRVRIEFDNLYPDISIYDIQMPFNNSNLFAMSIQNNKTDDIAIIYQGSSSINDWRQDNFNNFLSKRIEQYDAGLEYFNFIRNQDLRITHVSGNSLGGGIAQYVGIAYPNVRALCLNASPLSHTQAINSTDNIIHIRNSSDALYRSIMLDDERFSRGYVGQVKLIKRSLYGSYQYYHHLELSHRGSTSFPKVFLFDKYQVTNEADLKKVMSKEDYLYFKQLDKSISIAQYIPLDLMSNNVDYSEGDDFTSLKHNLLTYQVKLAQNIKDYHLCNIEQASHHNWMKINKTINSDLKVIIKNSLLNITKQEEKLYYNVFYVIDKAVNYFYKKIIEHLDNYENSINPLFLDNDSAKIKDDLEYNNEMFEKINEINQLINIELTKIDSFNIKNYYFKKQPILTKKIPKAFSHNFYHDVFKTIDDNLKIHISDNRFFIEQIESFIIKALKASKITLNFPIIGTKSDVSKEDIDYIIKHYNFKAMLGSAIDIFKEDLYEIILGDSLLYTYYANIRNVNEQYEQYLLILNNLELHLGKVSKRHKKYLTYLINLNIEYIKIIINHNKSNLKY